MKPTEPEVEVVVGGEPGGEPPSAAPRRLGLVISALLVAAVVLGLATLLAEDTEPEATFPEADADPSGAIAAPSAPPDLPALGLGAGWSRVELPGGALFRAVDRGSTGWAAAGPDWDRDTSAVWTSRDARSWRLTAELPGIAVADLAVTDGGVVAVGVDTGGDEAVMWRESEPETLRRLDDARFHAVEVVGSTVVVGGSLRGQAALWWGGGLDPILLEGTPEAAGRVRDIDERVAVGELHGAPAVWHRRPDGSWGFLPGPGGHPLTGVAVTDGVTVTGGGRTWRSEDLTTWEPAPGGEMVALAANGPEVLAVERRQGELRVMRLAGGSLVDAVGLDPGTIADLEVAETAVAVGWSPDRQSAVWVPRDQAGAPVGYRVPRGDWGTLALLPNPASDPAFEPARLPGGTFVWTRVGSFLVTEGGSLVSLDPAPPPGGWLAGRVEIGERVVSPGPDGELWVSEDGGRRWSRVEVEGATILAITRDGDEVVGVARSPDGMLFGRSPDGRSWDLAPVDSPWDPVLVEGVPGGFVARDARTRDRIVSDAGGAWAQAGPGDPLAAWGLVRADLPTLHTLDEAGVHPSTLERERVWGDGEGVWRVEEGELLRFAGATPMAVPLGVEEGLWAGRLNPVPRNGDPLVVGLFRDRVAVWRYADGR